MKNIYYKHVNPFKYNRLKTREVKVGNVGIGAKNPIRLQSMTIVDTMNTLAVVEESIRIINAGGELARVTTPSIKEAKNLINIKKELRKRGYDVPIVADVHYTPKAAELAARIVEKVRINPGNYADKKKFQYKEYSDKEYSEELQRIYERFLPLVKICKEYGTAMRIGTNHGSLSDRILSKYGDTPEGMVESAWEFVKICIEENYYSIVLSMKASNPLIMVQAYRLLVTKMIKENIVFPLHLGVTEAGNGMEGRIKSSIGIGTLLADGIGDTIRVSLTEAPENEIPVAKKIVEKIKQEYSKKKNFKIKKQYYFNVNPFEYNKRETNAIEPCYVSSSENKYQGTGIGGKNVPRIVIDISKYNIKQSILFSLGYRYSIKNNKWHIDERAIDYIYTGKKTVNFDLPGNLSVICDFKVWNKSLKKHYPLIDFNDFNNEFFVDLPQLVFVEINKKSLLEGNLSNYDKDNIVWVINPSGSQTVHFYRKIISFLNACKLKHPVILFSKFMGNETEKFVLDISSDFGSPLLDGICDGIFISSPDIDLNTQTQTAFNILQASRTRISKTEYISCPSCGRTLFDLQKTTTKIQERTSHLKGIKIAIMGCIVNGPGEMADADYGYVGTGKDKVTLYKGKEIIKRNIPSSKAVDELIELIKNNGDWIET